MEKGERTDLQPALLPDLFERASPIVLNGLLERARWHPGIVAILGAFLGMASYLVVGNVATVVLLLTSGVGVEAIMNDLAAVIQAQVGTLLTGNAIGLFGGMGALTLLLVRLHTPNIWSFVRLRKPDPRSLALAVGGLVVFIPIIQWVGQLNELMPMPEFLREMESLQMELLNDVLLGEMNLAVSLLLVAVTPALCEEVFFRGYVQRNLERAFGVGAAILSTGVLFGLLHLRPSQLLPLTLLGAYLAYLTWRTGSLWIPIAVHFFNNALAIVTAAIIGGREDYDIAALEAIDIPWYIITGCGILFGSVVYALHNATRKHHEGAKETS